MKFILMGHGHFGSGLKSNIEMISGEQKDIIAIDFIEELDEVVLHDLLSEELEEGSLIVVDILGGTPFKVAATLMQSFESVELIYGASVNAILEGFLLRGSDTQETVNTIITTTQTGVGRFALIEMDVKKDGGGI